ncbi:hypothetical protein [Planktothrix agardhii]|uniref:hypothetical protein n=1 Tax=Planktothrix agardhii TaxID=1160 RepID=UPI002876D4AC|nr:hypothetical protein [Planktothrix agardhii]MDS1348050.1 hypothetical protein [Planktothrix agardhii NRERC-751]
MNNFFGQLRQKLSKPVLFGLYGAMGCLGAATIFGEPLLQLTKISPKVDQSPLAIVLLIDTSGSMNPTFRRYLSQLNCQLNWNK